MTEATIICSIAKTLSARKIPCVLIGGFAVNFYKYPRQTADIDFLIRDTDINTIHPILETFGYKLFLRNKALVQYDGRKGNLMDVDLMLVDHDTFAKVVESGKKVKLGGSRVLIPSIDHLLAMKFHAVKHSQDGLGIKDLNDILRLSEIHKINISSAKFKKLCFTYGSDRIYEKIMILFN